MSNIDLYLKLIPGLPLLACLLTAATGVRWLKERSHLPTVVAIAGSFVCSVMLLFAVKSGNENTATIGYEHTVTLWNWATIDNAMQTEKGPATFALDITLRADPLTAIMLCMVTFVATLVAVYAAGYMHGDEGYPRFFTYVSLFVFSMTMLVSVSNFALLYVFWEAVGVCSYLLIGFWYEKPSAAAAGKKAFLVNRIGDFGFALGLFLIWTTYGTLNFHDVDGVNGVLGQANLANPTAFVGGGIATAICLLLLLGACGKSAQFPLHVWLPDAMEGPTPVSALIHAATMVTAGVYMVTRCTPLFMASVDAQLMVSIIGAFTALLAGLIALTQTDLKRVLAYSTVSQLGYMFLALGTGKLFGITAGMFHLFTHAFFKALLFLGSGSVMHAMGGIIDMRRFSGLRRIMPITHWTFLIGCLALAGIAPFAGFWSKDDILHSLHSAVENAEELNGEGLFGIAALKQANILQILYGSALLTAFLTSFYTFRAFFLTFYGEERVPHEAGHHAHESPRSMTVPLMLLAVCATGIGAYFHFTHGFLDFLQTTPSLAYQLVGHDPKHEEFNWTIAGISTAVALLGIMLAAFFYLGNTKEAEWLSRKFRPLYLLSYNKFYFDELYQGLIIVPLLAFASFAYWLDRYFVDGLVNFVGAVPPLVGATLRRGQAGLVQSYALLMLLGVLALIGALIFMPTG